MALFKVTIKAKGHNRIHGINFRDLVESLASKQNPLAIGQIRNRKKEEDVELQMPAQSEAEFNEFLEKVKTAAQKRLGIELELPPAISSENAEFFSKGFEVIRDDELKEMYWALQGAKDLFLKLYKKTMATETIREQHRLAGLKNELKRFSDNFSYKPEQEVEDYREATITNFLIEPFDDKLNSILNELNSARANFPKHKGKKMSEAVEFVNQINLCFEKAIKRVKELEKEKTDELEEINGIED